MKDACTVLLYCTWDIYYDTDLWAHKQKLWRFISKTRWPGGARKQKGQHADIGLPLPAVCVPSAFVVPSWLCIAMIWKLGATYNLYTYQPDAWWWTFLHGKLTSPVKDCLTCHSHHAYSCELLQPNKHICQCTQAIIQFARHIKSWWNNEHGASFSSCSWGEKQQLPLYNTTTSKRNMIKRTLAVCWKRQKVKAKRNADGPYVIFFF